MKQRVESCTEKKKLLISKTLRASFMQAEIRPSATFASSLSSVMTAFMKATCQKKKKKKKKHLLENELMSSRKKEKSYLGVMESESGVGVGESSEDGLGFGKLKPVEQIHGLLEHHEFDLHLFQNIQEELTKKGRLTRSPTLNIKERTTGNRRI